MDLLFIADGRSPIATNWINYFIAQGYAVHLISTYPCEIDSRLASFHFVPVGMSEYIGTNPKRVDKSILRKIIPVGMRTEIRQWLGPRTLSSAAKRVHDLVVKFNPDLIHAMRIPFEGILASLALREILRIPLVISVWGNDFTLHAPASRKLSDLTRQALKHANALHTDCQRDQRLAIQWGFTSGKPTLLAPGNGGIKMGIFYPSKTAANKPIIINPRGFRAYVRNDTFFYSIPHVLNEIPDAHFLCPGMAGEAQAQRWVLELGISNSVDLLEKQSLNQMAGLYRRSIISTSITTHDGTPNTLLEAMASGCYPIVGDIETMHEWIVNGINGLLVDPADPEKLAQAIVTSVNDHQRRLEAANINLELIEERADYQDVMEKVVIFYKDLIQ